MYRKCEVCKNDDVEVLYNLKFKLMEHIKLPDNYDIVFCPVCGFVYADTKATQDDYDIFYRDNNIYENDPSQSDIAKYDMIFNELSKHWDKEDSILEIGFASGSLLKMFEKNGYTKLFGLDPSKECVDKLNSVSITTIQGNILSKNVGKFKNIVLSHVLEHILDVEGALNSIYSMLEEDGTVYIEVPDMMQYIENNTLPFNFFDIEHINHYNQSSLSTLMFVHSFDVLSSGTKKWDIGDNKFYPATWVLCKKRNNPKLKVRDYIKTYVDTCLERKYPEIEDLVKSQEEIIVWGTGSLTQRLYSMANLSECNILNYVDNSKIKIGTSFNNRVVLNPNDIASGDIPILILSVYGTGEIIEQIKEMGLSNPVISLRCI